ncbi:MAG: hypothetical protein GY863_04090 [bacterium]|nr:hypothetical protein [bacterium]
MKKTILISIFILVAASFSLSAMAIGASYSLNVTESAAGDGALTFKLTELPPVFGLSFGGNSDYFRLGATADIWMYHKPLVSIVSIYIGPGAYINLGIGDTSTIALGARVPVGFQIFPLEPLELFLELAPRFGIQLTPDIDFPQLGLQGALGFRFWFN